jgi:hypothetical protein
MIVTCKNLYSHVGVLAYSRAREGPASMQVQRPTTASASIVVLAFCPALQPADGTQNPESSATSCAARLRECRAHGRARRRSGAPVASRLSIHIQYLHLCPHTPTRHGMYVDRSVCACDYLNKQCRNVCGC